MCQFVKIKPSWTQYNKTNSPIGKTYRAVMSKREGKKMLLSLHGYKGSAVIYALEYYCNIYNIIIFKGEHEKRHLEYHLRHLSKWEINSSDLPPAQTLLSYWYLPFCKYSHYRTNHSKEDTKYTKTPQYYYNTDIIVISIIL